MKEKSAFKEGKYMKIQLQNEKLTRNRRNQKKREKL